MDDRYLFHLRERSSWPRITKLRHKCLLCQLATPEHQDHHTFRLRLRLQPFERNLLQRTLDQLDTEATSSSLGESPSEKTASDGDAESAAIVLFFRWSWADGVLRQALTELDPEWVDECHGGDFSSALEVFAKQLRTRVRGRSDLYDRRYYRTEQLMRDNPWLHEKDCVIVEEVTVVPDPADMVLWKRLGAYVVCNIERMATWPGFGVELAEISRSKHGAFGLAARDFIARLAEETPDLPPRGLFEGMNESGSDDTDPERESLSGGETAAAAPLEQARERAQDWAKITAQKITEAEDVWDVWSFCRMAMASVQNLRYREEMAQLLTSQGFTRHWKTCEPDCGGGQGIFANEPFSEVLSQRPSEFASQFFKEDPEEYLELEFSRRVHESPIGQPMDQLPFIPWETLEGIDAKCLTELEYGLGLDSTALDGTLCAASLGVNEVFHHTLYLTDDLFPPHVESEYRYPGYMIDGKILFMRQKLEKTGFLKQLRYFWELWNDCAITFDTSTQDFFLLQTLPGVKARQLENRSGIWSAFELFDLKYRHRNTLDLQHDTLRQLLGNEYRPSYTDYLLFIDPREIDLANMKPAGQGSFGRVFKASWERKPVKVYDHVEESVGDIALKVALGDRSWDDRAKFFLELATVYSALAGDSSGCVPFFGFCKVFVDKEGQVLDSNSLGIIPQPARETFALIFDFATDGDILSFLRRRLEPGKPEENWLQICGALSGLASGLMTIHRKDIIHRDIHPQNVLVQSVRPAADGEIEFDCLLSDLGEGKDITQSAQIRDSRPSIGSRSSSPDSIAMSFSLVDFIAPETAEKSQRSMAGDIFAWGQLGVLIIQKNHELLRDEDGEVIYPAAFMKVLERCLDPNVEGRFDATSLVVVMDEVIDGPSGLAASAYGEETEWYDGSYELPRLQKKLESVYELGPCWSMLTSKGLTSLPES